MDFAVANEQAFEYLECIISALTKLYNQDQSIFDTHTHEQTYTFRLGHYLAEQLERPENNLFVDCEYHRDRFRSDGRKTAMVNGTASRFRPDIIYHNRGHINCFCIEFKKGSAGSDIEKVKRIVEQYAYREGYCICNVHSDRVTVLCIKPYCTIKRCYRYSISDQKLTECSCEIIQLGV